MLHRIYPPRPGAELRSNWQTGTSELLCDSLRACIWRTRSCGLNNTRPMHMEEIKDVGSHSNEHLPGCISHSLTSAGISWKRLTTRFPRLRIMMPHGGIARHSSMLLLAGMMLAVLMHGAAAQATVSASPPSLCLVPVAVVCCWKHP